MTEGRLAAAHRLLTERGPLTSSELAELMGIAPGNASAVLSYLMTDGGCEVAGKITPHKKNHARAHLWRAIPDWTPRQKGARQNLNGGLTPEDLAWMKHHQAVAEARQARKAAINEVRGRV